MPEFLKRRNIFRQFRIKFLSSNHKPGVGLSNRHRTRDGTSRIPLRNDDVSDVYSAIHTGDVNACKDLLSMGVVNLREGGGGCGVSYDAPRSTPPLHFAVMHRQPEIVKLILRNGAGPNRPDTDGKTAIHTCILYWPRHLPKTTPVPSRRSHSTEIALYHEYLRAVEVICRETLKRLCAFGGNVSARDSRQQTPLHYAARFNTPGAAKVLLGYGARLDVQDVDLMTPVMLAAAMGHECLKIFLDTKTELNHVCSLGKTALHHAVKSRCPQHKILACVKMLLRQGAMLNIQDKTGQTPLHSACKVADSSIITLLLQAGADADIRDANGKTPLHILLENLDVISIDSKTILRLVDATFSYTLPPTARIPFSAHLSGIEALYEALRKHETPPTLQRLCRKVLRSQLIMTSSIYNVIEDKISMLPLPKPLQRFLELDKTNPVRQIVLSLNIFR